MRALALDYGSARCGAAVCDPSGTIVRPLEVIKQAGTDIGMKRILEIVKELEVEIVIVGLPLSMSGGDTAQTMETRGFAKRLATALPDTPVKLYDERLTTKLAQRDGGSAPEDARAAAHLLDGWLMSQTTRVNDF